MIFTNWEKMHLCAQKSKFYHETLVLVGEFNVSSGWLMRFKQQYGIHKFDIKGE
jgi:hypothetical protein